MIKQISFLKEIVDVKYLHYIGTLAHKNNYDLREQYIEILEDF